MTSRRSKVDFERLRRTVDGITDHARSMKERGKVATYIPELAKGDTSKFGIAVDLGDGAVAMAGDADEPFSIQSISKVFALTLALEACGDDVWKRVGREPSGDPYNSIMDLERHKGVPRNPFINSGALVIADMLIGLSPGGKPRDFVLERLKDLTGDAEIGINEDVVNSEESSTFTNRALANLAKSFDNLHHDVATVHLNYVRQCAVALTTRQLARSGRYLTSDRVDPNSNVELDDARRARRILSVMLTCGQYDGSGDFAYRVGLPAKTGVGGGILAIVPNVASIAVWSPGLDANGNSVLGTMALERLAEAMDWSVFGAVEPGG